MERDQILKVMVPVGAFGLLLVVVGVVIALNSGGGTPTSAAAAPVTPSSEPSATPASSGMAVLGTVPIDDSGMSRELPSLTAAEWKDAGNPNVPGLKIWDVVEGTEDVTLIPTDGVKVHYIGWLTNGSSFDSSVARGQPIDFGLNGVIQGWTFGLPGMKVGGIRRLYIPARFAYGAQSKPGIPANSDLVFEVKLFRVMRPK